MRNHTRALVVAAVAALAVTAKADHAIDEAKKQLTARYAGISAAFARKDAAGITEPLDRNYKLKQPDGRTLDRAAIVNGMKQQMDAMNHPSWVRKIEQLTLKGNQATALVSGLFDATVAMQGKDHKFHMSTRTRDLWARKGAKWMLRSSEVISNRVEMDGQPVGAPGR